MKPDAAEFVNASSRPHFLVTSALAYWVIGYPLAFGGEPNVILGRRFWVSERFGAKDLRPGIGSFTNYNNVYNLNNQDPYIHFFYHYMLAFLVTNIAASAFAERCRVPVYVLFSILMAGLFDEHEINPCTLSLSLHVGFVYPILTHWMWGAKGWLGDIVGARVSCGCSELQKLYNINSLGLWWQRDHLPHRRCGSIDRYDLSWSTIWPVRTSHVTALRS